MPKIILFPVASHMKDMPGHKLFAANYLERISKGEIKVRYLYYKQTNYSKWTSLKTAWKLMLRILRTKHDALYYGTDPTNLLFISFLKMLRIYNKPVFCWKYTPLLNDKAWTRRMLKAYYHTFNKIFFITKKHIAPYIERGIASPSQCVYLKWGEDLDYIDRITHAPESETYTFLSTGKAFRDFDTMIEAFKGIEHARLKIITTRSFSHCDYTPTLQKANHMENVEVVYLDGKDNAYDFIYREILQSSCALVICQKVNFGVGYTSVLDAMSCGKPLICTRHKDNPIDVDACQIGLSVPPYDKQALHTAMKALVDEPHKGKCMGENGRKLAEKEYNCEAVARNVLKEIMPLLR